MDRSRRYKQRWATLGMSDSLRSVSTCWCAPRHPIVDDQGGLFFFFFFHQEGSAGQPGWARGSVNFCLAVGAPTRSLDLNTKSLLRICYLCFEAEIIPSFGHTPEQSSSRSSRSSGSSRPRRL